MVAKTNIKVDLIVVRDKAAHENTTVMIYDTKQPWPYFKEGRKRKEVVPEFRFSIGLSKNNKLIDTTGNLASIG